MKYFDVIKKIEENKLSTSEVIQSSFTNVFKELEKEDFVIVENTRKKKILVIQELSKFGEVKDELVEIQKQLSPNVISSIAENRLLARQYLKENTYFLMRFESENITFPKVEYYLNNKIESNEYYFEKDVTINLVNAWKHIITTNDKLIDISMILDIHAIVAKDQAMDFGHLRDGQVNVSGTNYKPEVPSEKSINDLIQEFRQSTNIYKAASKLLMKMIKAQPFWDGNKRTSFLTVNKLLIDNAKGLLIINDENFKRFSEILNDYYNDENKLDVAIEFLINNCFYNTKDKKLI